MPKKQADPSVVPQLLGLLALPDEVDATQTVYYDLMARGLTVDDACELIVDYIRAGGQIRETLMRGRDRGKPGYEFKLRLKKEQIYVKVVIRMKTGSKERICIVSFHPDC